jgi:hypothetical protein
MSTWPEDILVIVYPELGIDNQRRLTLLLLISKLLQISPGIYDASSLGLSMQEWYMLSSWVQQQENPYFWYVVSEQIRVIHRCEQHVLAGTGLLLEDLSHYKNLSAREPKLTLDGIWYQVRNVASQAKEVSNT